MNIVLWLGNEANQKALANKIHQKFPLVGIVTETRKGRSAVTIKKLAGKIIEKLFLSEIGDAWIGMLKYFEKLFPFYPKVPLLNTENINNENVLVFTKNLNPDLIIVSGTRLIKKDLLAIEPGIGIMNLHTGLSPYVKGGPNCTNWCIATKQFHLIGNTVMWIDKGIDTGNLIATEFTSFNGTESLLELHIKVMEHAHNLYVRSIQNAEMNKMNNIPQNEIAPGKTYYTKQWGLKEKIQLVKNFKQFANEIFSGEIDKKRTSIKTVTLQ
jgi:methionyl-tRNA formyltransferase